MANNTKTNHEIIRVAGRLREVVTVHDAEGKLIHKMISPLMVEFHAHDLVQVMVGASILAIPVGFTEEVWQMGNVLPYSRVFGIALLSIFFISAFVYYNSYQNHIREHWDEFLKRVLTTYILSLLIVALILTLVQVAPWQADFAVAMKRVILVAFPASMSAAIADMLK